MRWTIVKLLVVALSSFVGYATAQDYDVVRDYSETSNTDLDIWSYRYKDNTVRDGNYALLSVFTPSHQAEVWSPGPAPGAWETGETTPCVSVNDTGVAQTSISQSGPAVWPVDTMKVHPGVSGIVAVSWLSRISGPVDIAFSFIDMDPYGSPGLGDDGIKWFVEKDDQDNTLASGQLVNGGSSGGLSLTDVDVVVGSRINFIVDLNLHYNYDSTLLSASISAVPEPSAAIMLITGLVGAAILWRRK